MTWKSYNNPLYDDIQDPDDWTQGLCCIFANALRERFDLPMRALVVESMHDGSELLVHAFAQLPDGRIVDALGVRSHAAMMQAYQDHTQQYWRIAACFTHAPYDTAAIKVHTRDVALDDLWDLNPEDHEATNAAHAFIDRQPRRFKALLDMEKARCASHVLTTSASNKPF